MIASIVVFYNPNYEELLHIKDYCNQVNCVIVVDNSLESNYESLKCIIDKGFEYRHYPQNIGFCSALNVGVDIASECGCEWVLIMDSDSSFKTNLIDVYSDQIKRIDDRVAVLSPVHIHDRSTKLPYDGTKEVKWAMTSGCLYRIETFEKLGGFMNELFVDGLDIEYCYRARDNGYLILECGNAVLNHHPAETQMVKLFGIKKLNIGYSSPWRYYMQARSLVYVILKYRSLSSILMLTWKWIKVLFWLKPRNEYIIQMNRGMCAGKELYRKFGRGDNKS